MKHSDLPNRLEAVLASNQVCVLSVLLPDGLIGSSAMHYSYVPGSGDLYFSTDRSTEKFQVLENEPKSCIGAVVVGLEHSANETLQMKGQLTIVAPDELEQVRAFHSTQVPTSWEFEDLPGTVFLRFHVERYKLTDYSDPEPVVTIYPPPDRWPDP